MHRSARREPRFPQYARSRVRFNGAVHRSARRDSKDSESLRSITSLQRGRAPECTERSSTRKRFATSEAASTGPCTGVHGEGQEMGGQVRCDPASTGPCTGVHGENLWREQTCLCDHASTGPCTGVHGEQGKALSMIACCVSFNGAVHRSARRAERKRLCWQPWPGFNGAVHRSARRDLRPRTWPPDMVGASTGPCTGVHGERVASLFVKHRREGFNGAVHRSARRARPACASLLPPCALQRGRAPECTESWSARNRAWVNTPLQRGRAPECTESRCSRIAKSPIRPRFNGAVHRSARRVQFD